MDFAKKILGKYGWKEGDGLGKNSNGIAEPLKANLKFDNAGLGVDRAAEFNDHWWERCFNEAADNVDVKKDQNGKISMQRKHGEEAVEISTKSYSVSKLKKAKQKEAKGDTDENGTAVYDNFLKSATLTQSGGEVASATSIGVDDIAVTMVKVLTDEELFRACGGRTAHKGARHGLKLSGKLARLEQQEKELLAKMQLQPEQAKSAAEEEVLKCKKKKKHKQNKQTTESIETVDDSVPSKKKKKRKHEASVAAEIEDHTEQVTEETLKKKKKHKKEKTDETLAAPLKTKKKKKKA